MGFTWNNVIKDQCRGMDAASAWYKEDRRRRKEAADEYDRRIRENAERRARRP